jgi:predicted RNA-binding protein YlxR (DUF448 family)
MASTRERRCLVSGTVRPTDEMIRFVVGPDGMVVPDVEGRLPGRGLWITAERALIEKAASKKRFKAAGGTAPDGLADMTAALVRGKLLSLIGLARRTGDLLAGFDVIDRAVSRGEAVAVLIEAADAAPDGRRKMMARIIKADGGARDGAIPVFDGFDRDTLSQAVGRENATHLAVKRSRLAEKIQLEMTRLAGLEGTRQVHEEG